MYSTGASVLVVLVLCLVHASRDSVLLQVSSASHELLLVPWKNQCEGCQGECKAVPDPSQGGVSDDVCAPCKHGQTWWPCNANKAQCECSSISESPTALPSPQPTIMPTVPTTTTLLSCGACTECIFGNGACHDVSQSYCEAWATNTWCGAVGSATATLAPTVESTTTSVSMATSAPTPMQTSPTAAPVMSTSSSTFTVATSQLPTTTATSQLPTTTADGLPPSGDATIDKVIQALETANSAGVFRYEKPGNVWEPSDLYTWADMTNAVYKMATMGVGKLKLWAGGDNHIYGLVNIAAFLAQVMQETIRYNACDENNWSDRATMSGDSTMLEGAVYPATAACGQLHQSYQHYQCSVEEDALAGGQMACDVDSDMETRAVTRASWYGSPPELFCAPKSKVPKAPRWETEGWCSPADRAAFQAKDLQEYFEYVNSEGKCQDYKGQRAGYWTYEGEQCSEAGCANMAAPLFNDTPARTDVEGCCWWGRGAIQTTGVCNFGKLNFYMGMRAALEGRQALYPDVDFCKAPWSICDPEGPPELKWVAGFFYWLNAVQPYSSKGWVYSDRLRAWVDGGRIRADNAFIDGASGIVNRGCHDAACDTGHLHAKTERRNNFYTVLDAMGL